MNDALKAAIKEAYVTAPSNDVVLETIAIEHSLLAAPIYLVKNLEDLELTLETAETVTFIACGFKMALPPSDDAGLQNLSLTMDNVDLRISSFIRTVKGSKEPVRVTYRPYLSSDPSQPQTDPCLQLVLSDISLNLFEASGKATFADVINKKFPSDKYTRSRFPSLGN